MFFTPEMVILVIGATRMYRALSTHFTTAYEYAPSFPPHTPHNTNPSLLSPSIGYSTRSEQPDGTPMHRMRSTIAFREVIPLDGGVESQRSDEDQDKGKRTTKLDSAEIDTPPPRAHSELTYARNA